MNVIEFTPLNARTDIYASYHSFFLHSRSKDVFFHIKIFVFSPFLLYLYEYYLNVTSSEC